MIFTLHNASSNMHQDFCFLLFPVFGKCKVQATRLFAFTSARRAGNCIWGILNVHWSFSLRFQIYNCFKAWFNLNENCRNFCTCDSDMHSMHTKHPAHAESQLEKVQKHSGVPKIGQKKFWRNHERKKPWQNCIIYKFHSKLFWPTDYTIIKKYKI